ncbi:MAG: heme o synthase [Magnetospirillum sp. WYHS-4]
MPASASPEAIAERARLSDYALLLKPRVMSLVVFSGLTGLLMAPGGVDPLTGFVAILLIAIGAGASGAINMWYDRDIDAHMTRTKDRPIPAGRMKPSAALWFGSVLSVASVIGMALLVNAVSAGLLAMTIGYYVFIYTMWLKRRTPQNIVIGGASGAFPPMIGWAAATGEVGFDSFILFLVIFLWTPPHFWALALFRSGDYAAAGVPMLPVVAGVKETKKQILIYSLILVPATLLPLATGMSGLIYGAGALALDALLLNRVRKVWNSDEVAAARGLFLFSILYLFLVFMLMLADRGLSLHVGHLV